jgi:cell division protein FtsL
MKKGFQKYHWQILNPLRWRKKFLVSLLAVYICVCIGFIDTYSLYTRYTISQEREDLIQKTQQLEKETLELEQKIKDIQDNKALLEKIAREEYGMKKPEETVYIVRTEE